MGRLNKYLRAPLKPPADADPALLAAAHDALAALLEQRREASPSAVEGWIKIHRFEVWSSITTASALRHAIELARREPPPREEPARGKGENGVSKKKVEPHESPAELPPELPALKPAPKPAKPTAKPKPAPVEAPAAVSNEPLTEVVRKALESVGAAAEDKKIKRWITRHYPGRTFKAASLAKAINAQRPASNGVHEKKAPAVSVKPKSAPAPATGGYDPTRSELLRVLSIAREQGGVTKLVKQVQAVKLLADQIGGVDRLAVCLEALEELGVR